MDSPLDLPPRRSTGIDLLEGIPRQLGLRLQTWRGIVVHSIRPPGSMTFRPPGDFVAVMLAPSLRLEGRLGGERTTIIDAPIGMLSINPAGVESFAHWSSLKENLAIGFQPGVLAELAARELDMPDLDLQPPPAGHVDPQAMQMALLITRELLDGAANELYVDSLVTALGLHIVRGYSGTGPMRKSSKGGSGGLSKAGSRRVQEFLREHFSGKVSVQILADLCGLSPGHFIHAFTKTFGEPPHRHLIKMRLVFAEQLLSQTKLSISDIAHLSGFSSQSHLTSTMSKHKRTTPAQIRASR